MSSTNKNSGMGMLRRKAFSVLRMAVNDRDHTRLILTVVMALIVVVMAAVSAKNTRVSEKSADSPDGAVSPTASSDMVSYTAATQNATYTGSPTQDTEDAVDGSSESTTYPDYEEALASLSAGALKTVTVTLDPGHGGIDGGTYHGDILEKDLNLALALELGGMLEDLEINIIYTRQTDILVPLDEIGRIVENSGADLFLCIHHNATDDGPVWDGTETHYETCGAAIGVMDDRKFGQYIQEEVTAALGLADIGLIRSPQMVVLKATSMPGVIIEMGYVSSENDRAVLTAPGYTPKAATALKRGIVRAIAAKLTGSCQ